MILWQILVNSTYFSGRLVGLDCYCNTKRIVQTKRAFSLVQTCEQLKETNSPENKDTERKMSRKELKHFSIETKYKYLMYQM